MMKNLKLLRKQKNITQEKLADVLGISRSAVAMWETGATEPDIKTAIKLAEFFGTTVDFIYGLQNSEKPNYYPNNIKLKDNERLIIGSDGEKKIIVLTETEMKIFDTIVNDRTKIKKN